MTRSEHFFWPVIILFFVLWTLRVIYLPAPQTTDALSFVMNTSIRILLFFLPIALLSAYFFKDKVKEVFALTMPTRIGMALATFYSVFLIYAEAASRVLVLPTNPWIWISFPIAPIIEELVFRGFIFTHLLRRVGKWQTVCISSVLFVFIHFPGWIFLSGLQGENFLTITGTVLIFGLIQGVIRLYSKSVYPNIVVHMINNALALL